jgi:hypothetical protein
MPLTKETSLPSLAQPPQPNNLLGPVVVSTANVLGEAGPLPSQGPGSLEKSLAQLKIHGGNASTPESSDAENAESLPVARQLDDEKNHCSNASKAPSLDGKSVASGATFAMDEKGSIRPDDSASVKAAEEDEPNSASGSGAASSRVGSEAGGKAFRDQFNEISERMSSPNNQRPGPMGRGPVRVLAGQAGHNMPPINNSASAPSGMAGSEFPPLYAHDEPDEKLLEALQTPKDRMFLLQLEQKVIVFVRDSQ